MRINRETIVAVAMLAPTLGAYRAMHLANTAFDAACYRQYHVRIRFRVWRVTSIPAYPYTFRQQYLHGKHVDGHQLVIRDDGSLYTHKYTMFGIPHGKCIFWYDSGVMAERRTYHRGDPDPEPYVVEPLRYGSA